MKRPLKTSEVFLPTMESLLDEVRFVLSECSDDDLTAKLAELASSGQGASPELNDALRDLAENCARRLISTWSRTPDYACPAAEIRRGLQSLFFRDGSFQCSDQLILSSSALAADTELRTALLETDAARGLSGLQEAAMKCSSEVERAILEAFQLAVRPFVGSVVMPSSAWRVVRQQMVECLDGKRRLLCGFSITPSGDIAATSIIIGPPV